MRKILLVLGCLGLIVIALLASGTAFVAQEAKEFVAAEVDKERASRCKAMRAEFQDSWNRAVDTGRLPQLEERLSAQEQELNAYCGRK